MTFWMIALVAVVSTAACVFLWFRDVRRIMRERKSIVESAESQLAVFRDRTGKSRDDADTAAILERSESIYCQAVEHYNRTLNRPWVYPPAALMGYRTISYGGKK